MCVGNSQIFLRYSWKCTHCTDGFHNGVRRNEKWLRQYFKIWTRCVGKKCREGVGQRKIELEQRRRQQRIKCEKLITMRVDHMLAHFFHSLLSKSLYAWPVWRDITFWYTNHLVCTVHTLTQEHINFSMSFAPEHTFLLLLFSFAIIIARLCICVRRVSSCAVVVVGFFIVSPSGCFLSLTHSYWEHNDVIYDCACTKWARTHMHFALSMSNRDRILKWDYMFELLA